MPENIIETLNKITEEKGSDYSQVLVDGINIGMVLGSIEKKTETAERPGA